MIPPEAAQMVADAARREKVTIVAIGPTHAFVRYDMFYPLIDTLLQSIKRSRRYSLIELYNGSVIYFVSPQNLHLSLPGLWIDRIWLHGSISGRDMEFLCSRRSVNGCDIIHSE